MAILKKIFRYPIKGLSGENIEKILLEKDQVLLGDREYAFAKSHVLFDENNPVYLRKTNFLALVKEEKLAELRTEFISNSKRLIVKVDNITFSSSLEKLSFKSSAYLELYKNDLNLGVIEPAPADEDTEWCHREVYVAKSSGTPRRCIDYKPGLNWWVKRDAYATDSPFHVVKRIPSNTWKLQTIPTNK